MALEFDPTQVPAILATLFSAGTLGGVIKLTRWTANHDSRAAQLEKDLAKHCEDDKEVHELHAAKIDRRGRSIVRLEAQIEEIHRHRTNG